RAGTSGSRGGCTVHAGHYRFVQIVADTADNSQDIIDGTKWLPAGEGHPATPHPELTQPSTTRYTLNISKNETPSKGRTMNTKLIGLTTESINFTNNSFRKE